VYAPLGEPAVFYEKNWKGFGIAENIQNLKKPKFILDQLKENRSELNL
jgi:hypothetical protein